MDYFIVKDTQREKILIRVLQIASLVIVLAIATLSFRSAELIVGKPITEDGFYSLSVSRNIAMGNGITIDGVSATNGFQPLFTFLIVPLVVAIGSNHYTILRMVLVVHWIVFLVASFLLGRIVRDMNPFVDAQIRSVRFWLTVFLYLSSVSNFLLSFNGLETGFLLLMYIITWRYYQVSNGNQLKHYFLFGVCLGLTVLPGLMLYSFCLLSSFSYYILSSWSTVSCSYDRISIVSATAFLISSPWWLYNYFQFGTLVPSSGMAQQRWAVSGERIAAGVSALFQVAVPSVFVGTATLEGIVFDVIRIVLVLTMGIFLWKGRRNLLSPDGSMAEVHVLRTMRFGLIIVCTTLLLAVWYVFSSFASWFYLRYFAPLLLPGLMAFAFTLSSLWRRFSRIVFVIVSVLLLPILASIYLLCQGKYCSEYYHNQLALIQEHVDSSAIVGAYQSGTIGYFRARVVNLDGKVNQEALRRKSDLIGYIHERHIEWLCDWYWAAPSLFQKDPQKQRWEFIARKGNFVLYHYNLLDGH